MRLILEALAFAGTGMIAGWMLANVIDAYHTTFGGK
jgi:hypothetical protein